MADDLIQLALDAVPDPMLEIDGRSDITRANGAARVLFGDWIIGRSCDAALRQPALLSQIDRTQRGEGAGEARLERSDQTGITQYKVRLTPLPRAEMGLTPLLLHFTDITHLREAEEMRRDFVANVSHELRTPLTAVLGFIETLRGPARDDPAAQDRFLSIIADEAKRMNRLVSDLLSLSRVESEERLRPSQEVAVIPLLTGVLAALRPSAEETGNKFELEIDPEASAAEPRVLGDRDQLMQVFLNLVENALKYGGRDKPVTLRLGLETGRGSLKGQVARVEVTDRGEGIDPLHLPRLTERFYRVDTHRSREMGGTGLGLAIVTLNVNRHRGRVRIHSEPGKGSTFTVHLPVI